LPGAASRKEAASIAALSEPESLAAASAATALFASAVMVLVEGWVCVAGARAASAPWAGRASLGRPEAKRRAADAKHGPMQSRERGRLVLLFSLTLI
jgi:hypothetical protein